MSLIVGYVWSTDSMYTNCCRWLINDFTFKKITNEVRSPIFHTTLLNQKYYWQLYAKNERKEDKDYLSVFLFNRSNIILNGSIRFTIFINDNPVEISSETNDCVIESNKGFGLRRFVESSTIKEAMLANFNHLVILCEIKYNSEKTRKKKLQMNLEVQRLKEFHMRMSSLFPNPEFSDIKFTFNEPDSLPLHLHKYVMANSSPTLANIFRSRPQLRILEIKKVKCKVFIEMVWYAYTGKLPEYFEVDLFRELMLAAKLYKMDRLEILCQAALCSEVSVENIFESLEIAQNYGVKQLQERASEYIAFNEIKVISEITEFPKLSNDDLNF
ncbi:TD and POZ domain-containing protein 2-like [Nasonia vitripennis]|uniref:BTB domain-containing protein n=1 Tax=Nasonia vitripennis TaxID=7425 RepID=A0A7M7H9A2_NASVI|nr:TD and POZ domain-containing protein 2-like [Nasonia vitripennis]